jgi:hypothetical protein
VNISLGRLCIRDVDPCTSGYGPQGGCCQQDNEYIGCYISDLLCCEGEVFVLLARYAAYVGSLTFCDGKRQ